MERRISVGVIGDFDPEFPPHPATPSKRLLHDGGLRVVGLDPDGEKAAVGKLENAGLAASGDATVRSNTVAP
jgi:hypothetical protein